MKRMTVITGMALCLLALLVTVNTSEAQSGNVKSSSAAPVKVDRGWAHGDVVAGRGQSEVVIENTLHTPVRVFLDGRAAGTVRARGAELIVVPDGNHNISVQSAARGGGTSREVRFHAQSQRFLFRATSPNSTSISLTRDGAYELSAARSASHGKGVGVAPTATAQGRGVTGTQQRQGRGIGVSGYDDDDDEVVEVVAAPVPVPAPAAPVAPAAAPPLTPVPAAPVAPVAAPVPAPAPAAPVAPVTAPAPAPVADAERPLAETALGKDRDAMLERLDAAVGATPTPAAQPQTAGANTLTDSRDKQTYRTVKIGNLTWMAQNLNHSTNGSFCYDNNASNCAKYGRLYTWDAAMKSCPTGWRLPNNDDWNHLISTVGDNAGKKLKSKSHLPKSNNGTDEFGFSALPGGSGMGSSYSNEGVFGTWWSATEHDVRAMGVDGVWAFNWGVCWAGSNMCNFNDLYSQSFRNDHGLSVRCVKNER